MIDHTVTLREWYDFYLVSMSVSQGNFLLAAVLLFFLPLLSGQYLVSLLVLRLRLLHLKVEKETLTYSYELERKHDRTSIHH